MPTIPSGDKLIFTSASVDMTERKSAQLNAKTHVYTMQDITDTVNAGAGPSIEDLNDLTDVLRDNTSGGSSNPKNDKLMLGGYSSGLGTIGDGLIYIGNPDSNAGYTSFGGFHSVVIGMDAGKNGLAADMVVIGNEAGNGGVPGSPFNLGSGGTKSVIIGTKSGKILGALTSSVVIGYNSCSGGFSNSSMAGGFITSIKNVVVGEESGPTGGPTTMSYTTIVGGGSGTQQQGTVHNTIVGSEAGTTLSTGTNNTILGYGAQSSTATVSNEFTLGNSSVATLRCAVTSITSLSDERDKKDIVDLEYGLDFIESLQPKQFTWDNRPETSTGFDEEGNQVEKEIESANKGKKDFGFIAQDVQPLDNDVLRLVYDENPDKLEMSYGKLVPILVKAVKELSEKVKALEAN
jgi:hypothetical protein|tara:strand:- start:1890 stop:3104 length:1215 start_codon:yes stop_codon:yes gene_type:complete